MKLNKEYIKVGTLAVCNDEDTTQIYIIDWLSDDKFECTLSYYSPNGKRWGGSGNSFPVSFFHSRTLMIVFALFVSLFAWI